MKFFKRLMVFSFLVSLLIHGAITFAETRVDNCLICGTWQLMSVTDVNQLTHQKTYPYGQHPQGYLNYLPNGHMAVILVRNDRPVPKTQHAPPQEAAQLYSTMTSYAGTYTIKNNIITHHIAVAWNPLWVNTDQQRYYELKNNYLTLTIMKKVNNQSIYSILVWKKVV